MVALKALGHRIMTLILRQTHNFKLILIRRVLHGIAMRLSAQYDSIYATGLGANPVQRGSLRSVGNAVGATASLPAGWLIDAYSLKKIFLVGTALMGVSSALFLCASLELSFSSYHPVLRGNPHHLTVMHCDLCWRTRQGRASDRSGLSRTLSSIVALVTPVIATWIKSISGGISVAGLRPICEEGTCRRG